MSLYNAKRQFQENLNLLPNPPKTREDMEKFNLYSGLLNLANSLEHIESKLSSLEGEIGFIKREVR